jgi:RNA polymerase sigma factor (sigma-70 family)
MKKDPLDRVTRDQLVAGYTKLALYLARKEARKFKNLREDLESEATLALLNAVAHIHQIKHSNYIGYISRYIRGALYVYINRQVKVMYIPRDAMLKMRKHELKKFQIGIDSKGIDIKDVENEIDVFDIFDTINRATKDLVEHKIIMFYLMNYTDLEISKEIDLSEDKVNKIKNNVLKKIRSVFESNQK